MIRNVATAAFLALLLGTGTASAAGKATSVTWQTAKGELARAARAAAREEITDARQMPNFTDEDVYAVQLDANGGRMLFVTLGWSGGYCGTAGCSSWVFAEQNGGWKRIGSLTLPDVAADFKIEPTAGPYPTLIGVTPKGGEYRMRFDAKTQRYK